MKTKTYWMIFVVVQTAGAILPKLAGLYSAKILLFAGLLLLFPGDLLASVFSGKLNPLIFYPAVLLINFAAWYALRKMLLLKADVVP